MPDVLPVYWVFTVISVAMMFSMIGMNFFILYKHTLEMKTWKKLEYQLILLRVTFDAFNGITGVMYIILTVIDLIHNVVPYEFSFTVGLTAFSLMEMRSFLAATIAVERVLATTIPFHFYRLRNRVSNIPILGFIISTGISCDAVLFGFCDYRYEPVPGCTNFNCATPICFQRYSSATRMIYSSTNVIFSIILCYKLFWLSWKQSSVNVDIRKANWLSLSDGLSSLFFELIPWVISYYGIVNTKACDDSENNLMLMIVFQPLGPIIGAFRTTGRVIEAFVILKLMKKDVVVHPNRISVVSRHN
uniref:G_PROTEIN_RECEP_F1_2 domain-containing protein n=1 Tax=Caenorhabditis tropicalis TaxID=1561998 RepID=A0A1I7SZ23_9PELO